MAMRPIFALRDFLRKEGSSGILLVFATAVGIFLANSPLKESYKKILAAGFKIDTNYFYLSLTTTKIINYLLMSLFFLVVGMEIKRELISGHLASFRKAVAPFIAALGGMLIPALIYLLVVRGEGSHGWAIPVATDIALALGVLALMGDRVSFAMKAFILALAVIDDIGAITIIALFYSKDISIIWLASGLVTALFLTIFFRFGYRSKIIIVFGSLFLWYCFYRSGIHPTLAGVLLGFAAPQSEKVESKLHTWSSFVIVPLFALANAGVEITGQSITAALESKIALGIFLGLVIGKPIGIILFTKIGSLTGISDPPQPNGRFSLLAAGSAAGIGFTVAIFISKLAFKDQQTQDVATTAVIAASLLSALISMVLNSTNRVLIDEREVDI